MNIEIDPVETVGDLISAASKVGSKSAVILSWDTDSAHLAGSFSTMEELRASLNSMKTFADSVLARMDQVEGESEGV